MDQERTQLLSFTFLDNARPGVFMVCSVRSYQRVLTARHTDVAPGQEGAGQTVAQGDESDGLLEKR